jgi:putative FmdB family regulatory protein
MPTYDFRCDECGKEFSDFCSIKDKHLVRCPDCGGKVSQRLTGFMYIGGSSSNGGNSGSCSGRSCSTCSGC